jgi:hypothetical protein
MQEELSRRPNPTTEAGRRRRGIAPTEPNDAGFTIAPTEPNDGGVGAGRV